MLLLLKTIGRRITANRSCKFGVALLLVAVPILYGSKFAETTSLGFVLLPGVLILGIGKVLSSAIVGRGHPRYTLYIGAGTTWTELIQTPLPRCFDALKAAAREVGSIQIQNRATIAGNLCNDLSRTYMRRRMLRRPCRVKSSDELTTRRNALGASGAHQLEHAGWHSIEVEP